MSDTNFRDPRTLPAAVALFNRTLKIQANDDDEFWEEDGGRRREYLDISERLHVVLSLMPWQTSPIDVVGLRPEWQGADDWKQAAELRAALMAIWTENITTMTLGRNATAALALMISTAHAEEIAPEFRVIANAAYVLAEYIYQPAQTVYPVSSTEATVLPFSRKGAMVVKRYGDCEFEITGGDISAKVQFNKLANWHDIDKRFQNQWTPGAVRILGSSPEAVCNSGKGCVGYMLLPMTDRVQTVLNSIRFVQQSSPTCHAAEIPMPTPEQLRPRF